MRSTSSRIKVYAPIVHGVRDNLLLPGAGKAEWFKDHDIAPEMVIVPAGASVMGSLYDDPHACEDEWPHHDVEIATPFAVSRFTVTFAEWDAAIAAGARLSRASDEGWGRGCQPVINVSWHDAQDYVVWLSQLTGQSYRLLSEAEWEYAARAGTATPFWWGEEASARLGNFDMSAETGDASDSRQRTVPSDTFDPNPWGLYQVHGNVWEWVEDAWFPDYLRAPADGSARVDADPSHRVLRGGAYTQPALECRSSTRIGYPAGYRFNNFGFRVARDLISRIHL